MNDTYHTQNDASQVPPVDTGAAPADPAETATRGKPPGQPEAGIQKPGPGGTLSTGDEASESAEEFDDPDGSLDAFD